MRCKQNDMAVITGGRTGTNLGTEVTCLAYVGTPEFLTPHNDVWRIDKPVTWSDGIERPYMPDSMLMPIRPHGEALSALIAETQEKDEEVTI